MKNTLYIWVLTLLPFTISGQVSFQLEAGIGTFNHENLKNFQNNIVSNLPGNIQILEAFPPYWMYSFSAYKDISNIYTAGIQVGLGSTGGRLYNSDYSGKYVFDLVTVYQSLSIPFGAKFISNNNSGVVFEFSPDIKYSTLKLSEELELYDQKVTDQLNLYFYSLSLIPSIKYYRNIGVLKVIGSAKWEQQLLVGSLNDQTGLGLTLKPNWTGVRYMLGVMYSLNLKD